MVQSLSSYGKEKEIDFHENFKSKPLAVSWGDFFLFSKGPLYLISWNWGKIFTQWLIM